MSSIAGRALVTDFDGTLTELAVDWAAIRRDLGISRIGELWRRGIEAFAPLTAAEVDGARDGIDRGGAMAFARTFETFAVLTDNSELAVQAFFERNPELQRRCVCVAGRESLAGTKHRRSVFRRGAAACLEALGVATGDCVYLGDHPTELAYAAELGFRVVDAAALE